MNLPAHIETATAVGSDEVGVGDYLGPLVVTSVYVASDQIKRLKAHGVRDSKNLSDSRIHQIANEIKDLLPHKTVIFENKHYNAMIEQGLNAHVVKSFLHNKAISELINSLPHYPEAIIVDEFASIKNHFNYLKQLPKKQNVVEKNVYFVKKGEAVHIAVAAASILARQTFVTFMDQLSGTYAMEILKGAGEKVDECSRRFIEKHGELAFKEICKWHFANTSRIIKK